MAPLADEVFTVETTPVPTIVEGHLRPTPLLTIAADRLVAGDLYAFVASGIMGGFIPSALGSAKNLAEVTFRAGGGSYYSVHHRQDMLIEAHSARYNGGHPFQIILVTNAPAADLHLVGNIDAAPDIGNLPGFVVDNPTIHAWNLTRIGAGDYRYAFSAASTTLTSSPQNLAALTSLTASKVWLLYWAVEFAHLDPSYLPTAWVTRSGTATDHLFATRQGDGLGTTVSYLGTFHRAWNNARLSQTFHKHRIGDWRIIDTSAETVSAATLWGQDRNTGSTASKITRADLLAINLTDATSGLSWDYIDSSLTEQLFGPYGDPDSVLVGFDNELAMSAAVVQSTRAFQGPNANLNLVRTASTRAGIAGAIRNPLAAGTWAGPKGVTLFDRRECLAQARTTEFLADIGTHCVRLWGESDDPNTVDDAKPLFRDLSQAMWLGRPNISPPVLVLETPGPEIQLLLGRQATLATSALDELPLYPDRVEEDTNQRIVEQRTAGGRVTKASRWTGTARRWQLRWSALEAADFATLVAFLRARDTQGGAFQWTPPDADAAVPVLLTTSGWTVQDLHRGVRSVSIDVDELVYVGA